MTIYVPSEVYSQARACGINVSRVATLALRAELDRRAQIRFGPARGASRHFRPVADREPTRGVEGKSHAADASRE